ncbi:MAG: serine--tRNA ligase [Bacteroidales bacterium]|nr:serine--tRNA ligase [Bacteroidales bacterium]
MLTVNKIKENPEAIIKSLAVKNFNAEKTVSEILSSDQKRRSLKTNLDNLQAEMNLLSKQIGQFFQQGKKEEAENAKNRTAEIKEQIKVTSDELNSTENCLEGLIIQLPNLPHVSVTKGKGDMDNVEVRAGGTIIKAKDNALPHWEIAKKYDIIDFELGNKITGAGFPVYKGKGAKLQRALINFFLENAIENGYKEVMPPLLVNEDSGFGTGQLPDKEGQMYHATEDNFYLIPTAEVPVTNIYRDVILNETDFPIKNTAYTPCFRREAGSYGSDVRGLNRLHQFDKVEIVRIEHPEKSYQALEEMVNYVEGLLVKLELPYRIMRLCGGDLSFTSALTYDFEVYSSAQDRWLEVSSVSNFEDFQANRLKLRYKSTETKKNLAAHTLNGSALALPRIVAALLENNQTEKGIKIPEALRAFTGFDFID